MSFSDETLMAYADGELDESTRSAVEQAMQRDPAVADRVRRHQALRSDVFGAFAPVVEEPVPPRLRAVARPGKVIHLNVARAARNEKQDKARWSWREWGAIAATLVVGLLAGSVGLRSVQRDAELASVAGKDGALIAHGKLADALSQQLAGAAQGAADVRIGVSFVSKEGGYCRSFMLGAAAGLACRDGGEWTIPVMAQAANGAAGAYRPAGSDMPGAVLDAIAQRIAGKPLGASDERTAQQQGWKR